jgi:hypothetical protein
MFVAIPSGDRQKSLKYRLPHAKSRTKSSVHLSPIKSSVQATGQMERFAFFIGEFPR